jgi:hypothetical protein
LVQVKVRKFTKLELSYWNGYYQDISDLKREQIYSVDKVYLNKQLFPLKRNRTKIWIFFYEGSGKFTDRLVLKKKWVPNNVPMNYLEGKENVKNCKVALVTKSKKRQNGYYESLPSCVLYKLKVWLVF